MHHPVNDEDGGGDDVDGDGDDGDDPIQAAFDHHHLWPGINLPHLMHYPVNDRDGDGDDGDDPIQAA